jgi:ADP-heptose:LPS heptosyltransferase
LAASPLRIGFAVGSVGESRRWPLESYAALGDKLAEELSAGIVLLGAPADRPLAEQVARIMRASTLNLTGETTVDEMPALLAALDLFVSNDSGSAHLAAVAQVPTLVFFGAGDPKVTAPLSKTCEVLTQPVDCAPCRKNTCRFNMECMTGITVERVLSRIRQRLETKAVSDAPA